MELKHSYLLICLALLLSSCAPVLTSDPYFTTIRQLHDVKLEMNLDQVTTALGVTPYEVYYNIDSQEIVVLYKYKHAMQKVPSNKVDSNDYLTGGTGYYKDPSTIYMTFDRDYKLKGFFTDAGKDSALKELMFENTVNELINNPDKYIKLIEQGKAITN